MPRQSSNNTSSQNSQNINRLTHQTLSSHHRTQNNHCFRDRSPKTPGKSSGKHVKTPGESAGFERTERQSRCKCADKKRRDDGRRDCSDSAVAYFVSIPFQKITLQYGP
ncbi:hypothetical protein JTB14_015205 [Gonioctena quinquepunctata]|nr:hypothetical protein JTB14_015205 [Gonioctena quinquepunctata]